MKISKFKEAYPSLLESYEKDLLPEDPREQFSGRFASESLLKKSSFILSDRLKFQAKNYGQWYKKDNKLIGVLANKDFTIKFENKINSSKNIHEINFFDINAVELTRANNSVTLKIPNKTEWVSVGNVWSGSFKNEGTGFQLENTILRLNRMLNLRCLGFRAFIHFMLKGENSTLSLVLRANINIENEEAILIQFIKENTIFNHRLFLTIGKLNETRKEFVVIKKCEIPIHEEREDLVKEDAIEVKATLVDYGNDKMKINIELIEYINRPFKLKYSDLFIPYFENFNFYVIGNGKNTILKKLVCEYFDRKQFEADSASSSFFSLGKCNCSLF